MASWDTHCQDAEKQSIVLQHMPLPIHGHMARFSASLPPEFLKKRGHADTVLNCGVSTYGDWQEPCWTSTRSNTNP
eukprot:2738997-Amphidinium_carterae.1